MQKPNLMRNLSRLHAQISTARLGCAIEAHSPYQLTYIFQNWTVQANSVITLATKTDKKAPVMKWAKYTGNKTLPQPSAYTHTSAAPLHTDEFHSPMPPDLLNIAQKAKMHENQLVRLAKSIPSMIKIAIKKAL
ncbi:hypothetical protein HAX54_019085 [Datura stramonium]|uniref:Uncharacterized protein n=1 Tax=Datura stramonium TaxID=4076 RepID=A0ABS8UP60_DATST|nr:hypothetical protein [Datura stramonium]